MDVTPVLLGTLSGDHNTRTQAEEQIEMAKTNNLPLLMSLLATELGNEGKEKHVRQAAGVQLKNCLVAKEDARAAEYNARWLAVDPAGRDQIKQMVLTALASVVHEARKTAAQCVAAIACIELPAKQWEPVIGELCNRVTGDHGNNDVKQSSLEALGYICEEIDPDALATQSNLILTAVIQGMRAEQVDDVRLAATKALWNTLEFAKTNFDAQQERHVIMQTVCETITSPSKEIKVAAFEVIVRVAEIYYLKLPDYMQVLYQLTITAIQTAVQQPDEDNDEIGQQAVEFWSTLCEEELERMEEAEDAREQNAALDPERASSNFVKGAASHLVPQLLEALCQQEDDQADGETWNLSMAAAVCLTRVAQTVENDIVPLVMPFIQEHIQSADWHRREAATLAFGSVLEGPEAKVLSQFMGPAMDVMIKLMKDPNVNVKDTAGWTIGRICEHHITSITQQHWQEMMRPLQPGMPPEQEGVLLAGLKDHPRVANNVCWALHNLAEHCEDRRNDPSNILSALFVDLAKALLECTQRPDGAENNLRCSAYEALNTTLSNAAHDTREHIKQIAPLIMQRLDESCKIQPLDAQDRERQNELQGLLCGTLQVVTQKLGPEAIPLCDQMMMLFLQVFGAKNSTVQEEALMAVGAVANATEAGFEKYMMHFRPFLSLGLSNCEEHQVCQVAVGVVGDICRALEGKVLPYCDEIVHLLLRNLQNPALNRNVKPPILSCFGDIALAIGGDFHKYLSVTMNMLVQAASLSATDGSNPDLLEYLNQLREGIFEAYTGILQGLRAGDKSAAFEPYISNALELIGALAVGLQNQSPSDDVIRAAVGVAGDLASALGPRFKQIAKQSPHNEHIKQLLKAARSSHDETTQQVAHWAKSTLA